MLSGGGLFMLWRLDEVCDGQVCGLGLVLVGGRFVLVAVFYLVAITYYFNRHDFSGATMAYIFPRTYIVL
jgi:hypothetical protein